MEALREAGRRARAFLIGEYPGAPVDYVMALAMVLAAMVVTAAA